MATVYDVAKYILSKTGQLTTMKLQKLLYYSQAWTLAWDDVPLFDEEFQAWANGPVCREMYNLHRGKFSVSYADIVKGNEKALTRNEAENVDIVLKTYGDKAPHWLSELTHMEAPWKLARVGCKNGDRCDTVITKESMQQYYGGLIDGEE